MKILCFRINDVNNEMLKIAKLRIIEVIGVAVDHWRLKGWIFFYFGTQFTGNSSGHEKYCT